MKLQRRKVEFNALLILKVTSCAQLGNVMCTATDALVLAVGRGHEAAKKKSGVKCLAHPKSHFLVILIESSSPFFIFAHPYLVIFPNRG